MLDEVVPFRRQLFWWSHYVPEEIRTFARPCRMMHFPSFPFISDADTQQAHTCKCGFADGRRIARIKLNRPKRLNAIAHPMPFEIRVRALLLLLLLLLWYFLRLKLVFSLSFFSGRRCRCMFSVMRAVRTPFERPTMIAPFASSFFRVKVEAFAQVCFALGDDTGTQPDTNFNPSN